MNFTAIDFETATGRHNSACAIAIVTVENGIITDSYYSLIQPPNNYYTQRNIEVHGIHPEDTATAPSFASLFKSQLLPRLANRLLVAHNVGFDRSVINACMADAGHPPIDAQWDCTLKIYREKGYKPCTLSDCCTALNIPLNHHQALSDATACAELYLRK